MNKMQGDIPLISLRDRSASNSSTEQIVVCNHGYDMAKKLSRLSLMMWTSFVRPYVPQAENAKMEQETQTSTFLI